jgi:hypothetical protein
VTHFNTTFANNHFVGGTGRLVHSADASLTSGFTAIADAGFQNPAAGDCRIAASSDALNAGSAASPALWARI